MPLFIWKPSYNLHIPEIDNDHRYLVGIINELYEAMKEGHGHELINLVIDRLLDYVDRHFQTEESFMRINHYPALESHELEHRRFCEQLREMDRQRRMGNKPSTIELMTFLCDWLRNHITATDKEFGQYLKWSRK